MTTPVWLWAVFTLIAAFSQTLRNTLQKDLTKTIGAVGATHARFLYGLPFGALFFTLIVLVSGVTPPLPGFDFVWMTVLGGLAQIAATGLMLTAMRARSFVIVTAYTKSEPLLVVAFSWLVLGERISAAATAAVALATLGVLAMSWPAAAMRQAGWTRPVGFGLASGALFAVSAVCFRGGILEVRSGLFLVDASLTLICALFFQASALSAWLAWRDMPVLLALLRSPGKALPAGFAGAFASQLWFLAFALQSASLVRAAALAEILFAQLVTRRVLREKFTHREGVGIVMLTFGVAGALLL
jgi:drug/metabolite transporter (DMT)-like permease